MFFLRFLGPSDPNKTVKSVKLSSKIILRRGSKKLQNGGQNDAKIDKNWIPEASKNDLKKHVQQVCKNEPKRVPIGCQDGAQDAPKRGQEAKKMRFCNKIPLGSLLGSILASFFIDFA